MELAEALKGNKGALATRSSDGIDLLAARVANHTDLVTISSSAVIPEIAKYNLNGQPLPTFDFSQPSDQDDLIKDFRVQAYRIEDLAVLAAEQGFTDWKPIPK